MMDEQWMPHKPETWPTRFGELQSDTQFSKYLGRWDTKLSSACHLGQAE